MGTKSLKAFTDLFKMLGAYAGNGYLAVDAAKCEAYITKASILTLCPHPDGSWRMAGEIINAAMRIHAYACWLAGCEEGNSGSGIRDTFAVHVMEDDEPYDAVLSIIITRKRSWRSLCLKRRHVEVLTFTDKN